MNAFPKILKNISSYLLFGIIFGVALGVIFGERTQNLVPLEKALDMFLQAVIIIYVPLALLNGFGALQAKEAIRLLIKAALLLLMLWAIVILTCLFINLFIPRAQPTSLDLSPESRGLVALLLRYLIPQNPIYEAVENLLPPLAFFSLFLGIAFMHEKSKEPLLSLLQEGTYILEKMLIWLVFLSPLKAALHFAVLSGNVNFVWLKPITFYIAIIIITCVFFSLYFLPMFASLVTPLSYKELVRRFAFVGLASFSTGQPLIAFPFIAESLRKIRLEFNFPVLDWRSTFRMIVPLAFSFAQLGNMLTMFFIFYFASFFHATLGLTQFFVLPLYSIILSIGSPSASISNLRFLVEQMHFPNQAIIYLQNIQNITINFKVLFSATAVLCLTLMIMMLHEKKIQKNWKKLSFFFIFSIIAFSGLLYGTHFFFPPRDAYREFIREKNLQESMGGELPNIQVVLYPKEQERGNFKLPAPGTFLSAIIEKKKLRAGFFSDIPPYCYYNAFGNLMGFDVAMMAQLAKELEVDLELVPLQIDRLEEDLNTGIYDIAIGAFIMDFSRLLNLSFSSFYQENSCALLSLRSDMKKYENLNEIKAMPGLKIGTADILVRRTKENFPNADVIGEVTWHELFNHHIDLYFESFVVSRFRSLSEPELIGLNFGDVFGKIYLCYGMPKLAPEWKSFIDEWLSLQKLSGFYDRQYEYWIVGAPISTKKARWNLLDAIKE
jgi:proton glutamate symport protein